MDAKDIVNKKFDKSTFSGYKMDDVDEYLRDVSVEYKKLQNENGELGKKLEVLADKIREYRGDEDALRDAILVAKKQGIIILNEAKEEAAKLEEASKETIAKRTKDTDELVSKKRELSEKTVADAKAEAERIISEAKAKADEIHTIMQQQTEREQIILQRTRKEVADYTSKLLSAYKTHISYIKALPEECENEFVVNTAKEVENRAEADSAFYKKTDENSSDNKKTAGKAEDFTLEKPNVNKDGETVESPLFNLNSGRKKEGSGKELQFSGKK